MKKLNKADVKKFNDLLNKSNNILITTHLNADGDAIGSSLAFALVLRKTGKKVDIITPNDYPEFLKWMKGLEMISVYHNNKNECLTLAKNADLILAIDFNDPKRLKDASELLTISKVPKVLIDHHPFPVNFAELKFSETDLGSSAELVFYLLRDMGLSNLIDRDVAEALFTGIMTDTGCFNYSCSYPEVYEVVAFLIRMGINKDEIYKHIYDSYSENRTRLMGYCLNQRMIVLKKYHTAYIWLDSNDLKKFNHEPGDTEGFVNLPFSIQGIRFTALFIEQDDHIKISFRSRGNFSVNEFASKHFNGGGHLNAAGAEWGLPMDKTIKKFEASLPQYESILK